MKKESVLKCFRNKKQNKKFYKVFMFRLYFLKKCVKLHYYWANLISLELVDYKSIIYFKVHSEFSSEIDLFAAIKI